MKYRIKQIGDNYYPQIKGLFGWRKFVDYTKEIVTYEWTTFSIIAGGRLPVHYNPYIYFPTLEEADKFIEDQKHMNKIQIYNR